MSRFLENDLSGYPDKHWPWPSSFDGKMCDEWAEHNGLIQVRGGHEWFVRFLGKTCVCMTGGMCGLVEERALGLHDHPWLDHESYWDGENGKQVLVVEPYGELDTHSMGEWVAWADRHDLDVAVSARSFYCPGKTLLIEITKRTT